MPGVFDRIGRAFSALLARHPDAPVETPPDLAMSPGFGVADADLSAFFSRQARLWQMAQDRTSRHKVRVRMDEEDGVISRALDICADVATAPDDEGDSGESFSLACDNEAVRVEAEVIADQLHLQQESGEIARRVVCFGNDFFELVASGDNTRIERNKLLPEEQIWRNLDEYERPEDPPWEQRTALQRKGEGIRFAEWQVVHYRYRADRRNIYGRGLLDCERDWVRLQAEEDAMVQARLMRAYDRIAHRVAVPWNASQEEKERALTEAQKAWQRTRTLSHSSGLGRRDNPTNVEQDLWVVQPILPQGFSVGELGPEMLKAENAQLQNIRDVEYLRARLLARLGVPMRYLNMGGAEAVRSAMGEGGVSQEDIQFARTIRQVQAAVRNGHMRQLVVALILRGLDPIRFPLTLQFPVISTADALRQAQIEKTRAEALKIVADLLEVPVEMMVDHYLGLSAEQRDLWFGENLEKLQAAMQAAADRKAQAAAQLQANLQRANQNQGPAAPEEQSLERIAASVLLMAEARLGGNGRAYGDPADLAAYPAPVRP